MRISYFSIIFRRKWCYSWSMDLFWFWLWHHFCKRLRRQRAAALDFPLVLIWLQKTLFWRRLVILPGSWCGKNLCCFLAKTVALKYWRTDALISQSQSLFAPKRHVLNKYHDEIMGWTNNDKKSQFGLLTFISFLFGEVRSHMFASPGTRRQGRHCRSVWLKRGRYDFHVMFCVAWCKKLILQVFIIILNMYVSKYVYIYISIFIFIDFSYISWSLAWSWKTTRS